MHGRTVNVQSYRGMLPAAKKSPSLSSGAKIGVASVEKGRQLPTQIPRGRQQAGSRVGLLGWGSTHLRLNEDAVTPGLNNKLQAGTVCLRNYSKV
jgi:hypothetical protein